MCENKLENRHVKAIIYQKNMQCLENIVSGLNMVYTGNSPQSPVISTDKII